MNRMVPSPVVALSIGPDLVRAIDKAADSEATTRAAWMRQAVVGRLRDEGHIPDRRPTAKPEASRVSDHA